MVAFLKYYPYMLNSNFENYDRHGCFGNKFRDGEIKKKITVGGVFNEREYSEADCPDLLICYINIYVTFQHIWPKCINYLNIYAVLSQVS